MSETEHSDPDPAPMKHSDAERVSGEQADRDESRESTDASDKEANSETEANSA